MENPFDKILAGLGNMKAMRRIHVDTFTENRIKNVAGEKMAQSDYGTIWFNFQELGGFFVLNTIIVSGSEIKSNKGTQLNFLKENTIELSLKSDEQKITSDFSNVSNRWITEISYDVAETHLKFISEKIFTEITLDFKKKSMPFIV
jgi:hypothetical protein